MLSQLMHHSGVVWQSLGKKVPHNLDAFFALENVEDTHVAEDEEELVLNRSFRKMELVPDGGENN